MPHRPLVLDTLGKLIDNGMQLTAYCHERDCGHSATLDLKELVARLGRNHDPSAARLLPHLTCLKCGANVKRGGEVSLRVGVDWGDRFSGPSPACR